jgi:hypothetical protein
MRLACVNLIDVATSKTQKFDITLRTTDEKKLPSQFCYEVVEYKLKPVGSALKRVIVAPKKASTNPDSNRMWH